MKTQHTAAEIYIPDLWHIAQSQESISDKEEILDVWHKAHKMRDTLIAQSDLLEACKALLEHIPVTYQGIGDDRKVMDTPTNRDILKAQTAIAKAEGK